MKIRTTQNAGSGSHPLPQNVHHLASHPIVMLALKVALAAGIAWQLGSTLPEPASRYPYYAPLGAFTVMYLTVSDSVMEAGRTLAALILGAAIAVPVLLASTPLNGLTVGLVVGLATLWCAQPHLGDQRSWVPLAALFVLTASGGDTEGFVVAYVCQVALGALVGLLVNVAVLPSLALRDVEDAQKDLRQAVATQLGAIADALERRESPTLQEWRALITDVSAPREWLRRTSDRAMRARRGNPRARARRGQPVGAALLTDAESMERIAWLVEDLTITLIEFNRDDNASLDQETRAHLAAVARSFAEVITSETEDDAGPASLVQQTQARLDDLVEHANALHAQTPEQSRLVLSLAVTMRRAVHTFDLLGYQQSAFEPDPGV